MGITEIVKGRLKGMGYEAECTLLATRTDAQKTCGPAYSRCSVLQSPPNLPDGYYEAVFCGHSAFLHRISGCWSLGVPWPQIGSRQHVPLRSVPALQWMTEI